MRAVVLIIENRQYYSQRLYTYLENNSQQFYDCVAINCLKQLKELADDIKRRIKIVICSEIFTPYVQNLFSEVVMLELKDSVVTDPDCSVMKENKAERRKLAVDRFTSAEKIRKIILSYINRPFLAANNVSEQDLSGNNKKNPNSFKTKAQDSQERNKMGCLLYFTPHLRVKSSKIILKTAIKKGYDTIYLPIMPLYQLQYSFRRGGDNNLGSLLMKFKSGRLTSVEKLGQYLYLHDNGYYSFNCPHRADDIVTANSRCLRDLVLLLQQYVKSRARKSHAFIEIAGLSLEKHSMLATLCDYVVIEAIKAKTDAAVIAQEELSLFLSQLPSSITVYDSDQIVKLSEEAPWLY